MYVCSVLAEVPLGSFAFAGLMSTGKETVPCEQLVSPTLCERETTASYR